MRYERMGQAEARLGQKIAVLLPPAAGLSIAGPGTMVPGPAAQYNLTNPDSRIMPSKGGFIRAYNG